MWNGIVKYDGAEYWFVGYVDGSPAGAGQVPAARRVKTQRPERVK